jgi:hypothetical protein
MAVVAVITLATACGGRTGGLAVPDSGGSGEGSGGSRATGSGGASGSGACVPAIARASSVVSNFTGNTAVLPNEGRMGGWYVYFEGDADAAHPNNFFERLDPRKTTGSPPADGTAGGPCSGPGSLRQKGTGVSGWGVRLGTDLAPKTTSRKKGFFNAVSYGYRGLRVWARCAAPTPHAQVLLASGDTDFDAPAPLCTSYADCSFHGVHELTIGAAWQPIDVAFATAIQNPDPAVFATVIPTLDATRITSVHIGILANRDAAGTVTPNDFECWFDDVHFYP